MRRFLFLATMVVLMLVVFLSGTGLLLAAAGPFQPGDLFFPVQHFAEQVRTRFTNNQTARALYLLNLAERRTGDLLDLSTSKHEVSALEYLDQAVDQVAAAISAAPAADAIVLARRLADLTANTEAALSSLTRVQNENNALYTAFQAKVSILRNLEEITGTARSSLDETNQSQVMLPFLTKSTSNADVEPDPTIDPRAVAFLPGSAGAQHAFFPLTGRHADLQCTACHVDGRYSGTPTQCEGCHALDEPASHFTGACTACHNPVSWSSVTFDHSAAGAKDCLACHQNDKPANHFSGQCSACHNTANWSSATFNHHAVNTSDCQSCHSQDKPKNHFSGQCSQCHNTSKWREATFNHQAAGASDCQNCHIDDRPANHPSGQCSQCHNTSNWGNATFDHQAAGATDCQACHANDRPANHFSGQCSQCHNTNSWGDADFNHSFPMNHGDANEDCAKCHPSGGAEWTCYTCHDQGKMEDKHSEQGISNLSTECLDCHPGGKEHD